MGSNIFLAIPASLLKKVLILLDDGGLSAILKVQTIRIHSDSIKALEILF